VVGKRIKRNAFLLRRYGFAIPSDDPTIRAGLLGIVLVIRLRIGSRGIRLPILIVAHTLLLGRRGWRERNRNRNRLVPLRVWCQALATATLPKGACFANAQDDTVVVYVFVVVFRGVEIHASLGLPYTSTAVHTPQESLGGNR
jgi:hypothetical protein